MHSDCVNDINNATGIPQKKKRRLSEQHFLPANTAEWPAVMRSKLEQFHAYCTLCQRDFSVRHGGRFDIQRYLKNTGTSVTDQPLITRCTLVRSAQEHGRFSQMPIKTYRKKKCVGWRSVLICNLESLKAIASVLKLANKLDTLWLSSFCLLRPRAARSSKLQ